MVNSCHTSRDQSIEHVGSRKIKNAQVPLDQHARIEHRGQICVEMKFTFETYGVQKQTVVVFVLQEICLRENKGSLGPQIVPIEPRIIDGYGPTGHEHCEPRDGFFFGGFFLSPFLFI